MKLSNPSNFIREFRRINSETAQRWTQVLRKQGIVAPTLPGETLRLSRIRTWNEYLRLILIHWYLPKDLYCLIHIELEEKIHKFGPDKAIVALTILKSEPNCVIYISESSSIFRTSREAFGQILSQIDLTKYRLQRLIPRKPRRKPRRKGYNDHSSRRPDHKWRESQDYTLTELQNKIEEDRNTQIDTALLIEGGLP